MKNIDYVKSKIVEYVIKHPGCTPREISTYLKPFGRIFNKEPGQIGYIIGDINDIENIKDKNNRSHYYHNSHCTPANNKEILEYAFIYFAERDNKPNKLFWIKTYIENELLREGRNKEVDINSLEKIIYGASNMFELVSAEPIIYKLYDDVYQEIIKENKELA